jgi:hypothetical protein
MHDRHRTSNFFSFTVVLCGLFLFACSNQNEEVESLYDIDSVIHRQINHFIEHVEIQKKAVLNGVEKITTIHPKDVLDWEEELAIFLELDIINRPINRTAYKVEDLADNESNLRIKSFTTTDELPVKFLKIYYYKTMDQVRKIEAEYTAKNSLYKSARLLTLEFENVSGKATLTSYSVDGGQKMFLDDSVQYTIDAGIAQKE